MFQKVQRKSYVYKQLYHHRITVYTPTDSLQKNDWKTK